MIAGSFVVAALALLGADAPAERFSLCVTTPTRDGFVDASKSVLDSVADIKRALRKAKEFQLVVACETATIVLTVDSRGTGEILEPCMVVVPSVSHRSWISVPDGRWVHAVVRVREFNRELVGRDSGEWTGAAESLVNELRAWVKANGEQIRGPH